MEIRCGDRWSWGDGSRKRRMNEQDMPVVVFVEARAEKIAYFWPCFLFLSDFSIVPMCLHEIAYLWRAPSGASNRGPFFYISSCTITVPPFLERERCSRISFPFISSIKMGSRFPREKSRCTNCLNFFSPQ